MRKGKLTKRIAAVMVAMAATVMVAAPGAAQASCNHYLQARCTGNYVGYRTSSHTYGLINKKTCKTTQDLYNCTKKCEYCGKDFGVSYELHGHSVKHSTCGSYGESICGGAGSYCTYIY